MKYLILTSSIFFILGLKMTHNIEPDQKMDTDTVHIITVPETKDLPVIDEQRKLSAEPEKEKEGTGSGQLTAPKPSKPADQVR